MLASDILRIMKSRRKTYLKKKESAEKAILNKKLSKFYEDALSAWKARPKTYSGNTSPSLEFVEVSNPIINFGELKTYMSKKGFVIVQYPQTHTKHYSHLKVFLRT